MTTLSSPNRIVWEYFDTLRRLVSDVGRAPDITHRRQAAALAIIMAVTVAEVFLNVWFRVRLEERHSPQERDAFLKELNPPHPATLDHKLRHWPKRYLGTELDINLGVGAQFMRLKTLRNSIVHFSSTHETFRDGNVTIQGLADTSNYDSLSTESAERALLAAESLLAEIFRLAGAQVDQVPHLLHLWTGRPPVPVQNAV